MAITIEHNPAINATIRHRELSNRTVRLKKCSMMMQVEAIVRILYFQDSNTISYKSVPFLFWAILAGFLTFSIVCFSLLQNKQARCRRHASPFWR